MLVLGINSGFDLEYEHNWTKTGGEVHDTAAVLVKDGKVLFGIEEARLNRLKHTNKAPISAIRLCLESAGITLADLDKIAVCGTEESHNDYFLLHYLYDLKMKKIYDIRSELHRIFQVACGSDFDDQKLVFVNHQIAHGISAFRISGYDQSLVLTIDDCGDDASGSVLNVNRSTTTLLNSFSPANSLEQFYLAVIKYLGFNSIEDYQLMELASGGDPNKYQSIFKAIYTLLPDGNYSINPDYIPLLLSVVKPRKSGEPFDKTHLDIAASLQKSIEEIVLHLLKYYKGKTKQNHLCIAGGVARNYLLNGKILYSGMFEYIFVPPAVDDGGGSLGAALYAYYQDNPAPCVDKPEGVYWGTDIGDQETVSKVLSQWDKYITYESSPDLVKQTVNLLTDGSVIGWVQGRSEFGPQALGNRSIIADPRFEKNKELLNQMIKQFDFPQPLAASVLEEHLADFFEIPSPGFQFPFKNYYLKVRADQQKKLGAVILANGIARIQTVSRGANPLFWELINEFLSVTGVPVIGNRSLGNGLEPMAESISDALVCFLTSQLDYLVVGNFIVKRREINLSDYLSLVPKLPTHVVLHRQKKFGSFEEMVNVYTIANNDGDENLGCAEVSAAVFQILKNADGKKTLQELITQGAAEQNRESLAADFIRLWALRLISLSPA